MRTFIHKNFQKNPWRPEVQTGLFAEKETYRTKKQKLSLWSLIHLPPESPLNIWRLLACLILPQFHFWNKQSSNTQIIFEKQILSLHFFKKRKAMFISNFIDCGPPPLSPLHECSFGDISIILQWLYACDCVSRMFFSHFLRRGLFLLQMTWCSRKNKLWR